MYYKFRKEVHWLDVANDVFSVAMDFRSCAEKRSTVRNYQRHLKLSTKKPLEFVIIDLLGQLPKREHGHQFVLVITRRCFKFACFVPLRTAAPTAVANAFLNQRVYTYGVLAYVLTDIGRQLIAEFFEAVFSMLKTKRYLTNAYRAQATEETEQLSETIVHRLRYYVEKNQANWDVYLQPPANAYSLQVHGSKKLTPSGLVLTRRPSGLLLEGVTLRGKSTAAQESTGPM